MPAGCSTAAMQFVRLGGRSVVADFGGGVMTPVKFGSDDLGRERRRLDATDRTI